MYAIPVGSCTVVPAMIRACRADPYSGVRHRVLHTGRQLRNCRYALSAVRFFRESSRVIRIVGRIAALFFVFLFTFVWRAHPSRVRKEFDGEFFSQAMDVLLDIRNPPTWRALQWHIQRAEY